MNYAIEINNFSKSYADVQAVKNVNLKVNPGEIYGFLGLNGAGKTTTIRALLGMITPSKGTIKLLGETVNRTGKGPWDQVGYLVDSPSIYPNLTIRENLEIFRRYHGIKSIKSVDEVIDKLKIGPYTNRKAGTLSKGNLQRLGLARAIMHQPKLLILDEPINGLDPAGVVEIREMLTALVKNQGMTIFMSSHILTEVDLLATRIGILHKGQILEDLDKEKLAAFRTQKLEVLVRDNKLGLEILNNAGFTPHNGQEDSIYLHEQRAIESPEIIAELLVRGNSPPYRLALKQQNLEEHFMQLTGVSN